MAQAARDQNRVTVLMGVSDADGTTLLPVKIDHTTNRIMCSATGVGAGTVTSVSVVSANGFAGTVATATSTPAITLTTTVTGILSGNGTAISAASTTGSGSVVLANTPTLITPVLGVATGTSIALGGSDTMTVNGAAVTALYIGHAADVATAAIVEAHQHSNTAGRGAVNYYARSRGTLGAPLIVQSGDSVGQIDAVAYDGTDYATMASIEFEVDGTPGANDMPGRILFKTSPDGSQTLTTALTLKNDQSATFAGTVTMPTPFTLGATSVTTTGTQLNYLNAATGTTGTTSTNVVFSTSPTLVTPTLGVATATSINKVAITAPATSATLTIADGKTLTASNSLTLAGTDATTMTFPTTSATIARTDAGQTFTGVQSMTSPDITTSITTPSTTFSIANATATTLNIGGAATTVNFAGGSGAAINLGGGASAAELRFLEPSGSGTNYTALKAQAQAANLTYTLPAAQGAASTFLQNDGSGGLSWAAASGGTQKAIFAFECNYLGTNGNRYQTAVTGSGAVAENAGGLSVRTGATDGSYAILQANNPNTSNFTGFFDINPELHVLARPVDDTSTAFVWTMVAGGNLSGGTFPDNTGGYTVAHFGFILDQTTLYASNASGTTQTKTDISSGVTLTNVLSLKAIMTSGTNIKFYVNGSLKATHTTNLPTGDTASRLWCAMLDNDTGVTTNRVSFISNVTVLTD